MRERLYIAAKAPRAGFAKTRLGATIGYDAAVDLYAAFLRDLAARFSHAPFPVAWYITPSDAWPEIASLVACGAHSAAVFPQLGTDWAARQRALFRMAAARGEQRVVLIASDSPQITVEVVADAFDRLRQHDLVFGPVVDGGYYLIGMRGWHDIFGGVRMGTATVLRELVAQACALRLSVATVEPTFDVDLADDLEHLRGLIATRDDLPHTGAALARLGLLV